jgi:hypothetical protein
MDAGVQDTATTGAQVVNDSLLDRDTGVWDTESTGVPVVDYSAGAQRKSPPESTENTDHPGFGPTTSPHTAHSPPLTVDNDRTARTAPVCTPPLLVLPPIPIVMAHTPDPASQLRGSQISEPVMIGTLLVRVYALTCL